MANKLLVDNDFSVVKEKLKKIAEKNVSLKPKVELQLEINHHVDKEESDKDESDKDESDKDESD